MPDRDELRTTKAVRRPGWSAVRLIASHLSTGGMILAFHGIRDPNGSEESMMHVGASRFAAIVRALSAAVTWVSLRELAARHRAGRATGGQVAVTFDDAYVSVLNHAWDVIGRYGVPITLFVISDGAATGTPLWWDRVEGLCAMSTPQRWRAFEDECGLPEAYRLGQAADMGPLRPLRQWMLGNFAGRWPEALEAPLMRLESDTGYRPYQRPMTFDELDRAARNALVELGVHTKSHPVLPLLGDDDLRHEIRVNLEHLRERYPQTVPILSVPFGLYDERTIRLALSEGLVACLTLEATLLDDRHPHPIMPRVGITARHPAWVAVLSAMGCWRGVRPRAGAPRYPALPSATT